MLRANRSCVFSTVVCKHASGANFYHGYYVEDTVTILILFLVTQKSALPQKPSSWFLLEQFVLKGVAEVTELVVNYCHFS